MVAGFATGVGRELLTGETIWAQLARNPFAYLLAYSMVVGASLINGYLPLSRNRCRGGYHVFAGTDAGVVTMCHIISCRVSRMNNQLQGRSQLYSGRTCAMAQHDVQKCIVVVRVKMGLLH